MRRFIANRWWTLLLALVLGVGGVAGLPAVGRADGGGSNMVGDPNGTGGTTDPTNAGDPDIPINTGKCTLKPMSRTTRPASTTYSSPVSVGDATTAQLVWLYKFRIALQMFRVFVLR